MEIPLPEIIDKTSIVKLKIERVGEPQLQKELQEYEKALKEFKEKGVEIKQEWINKLYEINGKIWDLDWDLRKITTGENPFENAEKFGFKELGRRLLSIGDLMRKRAKIKNKITEETGFGFKDIKINHRGE